MRPTAGLGAVAALVASTAAVAAGPAALPPGPDFRAVLSLPSIGDARLAPDGRTVAYTVTAADWDANRYDTEVWLARPGEEPFPLTRTAAASSTAPRWSPDGRYVAFLADRGDGVQVWRIRADGGEARPLTAVEGGVEAFAWSPDGTRLAVTIRDPAGERRESVEKTYGTFEIADTDFRMTHLWVLDLAAALAKDGGATLPEDKDDEGSPLRRLTRGDGFTVGTFRWSPDGTAIAFDHAPDPRVESSDDADLAVVDVATGDRREIVRRKGYDGDPRWSPDGRSILFRTTNGRVEYWVDGELARVPAGGGTPVVLTEAFDEDPDPVAWTEAGIYFTALDRTSRRLYRVGPDGGRVEVATRDAPPVVGSVDVSRDGRRLAFVASGPETLDEVYRAAAGEAPERVTHATDATADWKVGTREVVRWTTEGGAEIEGVLLKPDGFDPKVEHPLLVVIHGGPAWLSFPSRVYGYVYPVQQWLEKGAVVLMPNYRGSAGYGEPFRASNVRNLGVGDVRDVLSGVDALIARGFVDPERMGAMGWSQGGYISAFLATTTDRFRAISVGAGTPDWTTYYFTTDIPPFTRFYLGATPWDDPEIYARTSPIHYLKGARTPTLIQHGERDARVPAPSAHELYRALEDVGVPTRLVIYEGFGHGITRPKERLAAVWHNWQWFAKYVWGEEVELPLE